MTLLNFIQSLNRRSIPVLLLLAISLVVGVPLAQAESNTGAHVDFQDNPNVQDWLRGRYVYLETSDNTWRGEEEWTLTHNTDGSRTMRIFTLLAATELMRDFTHRVDADFLPLESFQSLFRKGSWNGSGFYTFHKDRVNATVISPNGTFTQESEVSGPVTMIPHSMAGDAWHFATYDHDKGGVQKITAYNPSGWGDGIQSVLARVHTTEIAYKGKEKITVPAGTFDTDVWLMVQEDDGSWVNEIWIYGPHKIMVKFIDHPNGKTYLLDRLESPD